jgi:hypothetical protein
MAVDRVQIQDVISSQIPSYVKDDFPLLVDFLEEYYISQETQGGTLDLVENLDKYVQVDQLATLKTEGTLASDIDQYTTSITLSVDANFTYGFPENNGLIQIGNEIIKYSSKTETSFEGCTRGFSGVTQYANTLVQDKQTFTTSVAASHKAGDTVKNLSVLFLQEFLTKLKTQITPGFESRPLATNLNQKNFLVGADSFYKSKGTDESFKILFKAVYGVDVDIIKPNEQLLRPSDANYVLSQDYVVEKYLGDPLDLKNRTIYQNSTSARGTVTKVEKLNVDGDFYQISIDTGYQRDIDVDGTIYGKFEPNSKTKLLNSVSIGSTIIDVDSTIDFPSSGSLALIDDEGDTIFLSYTDKNLTQFTGVTTTTTGFTKGIDVRENDYSYANVDGNQLRVRILSTLKNIEYNEENFGFSKGDRISLKTIGIEDKTFKSDWFYNVKSKLDVKNITLTNPSSNIYQIEFFETHNYVVGYNVEVIDKDLNATYVGEITSIDSNKVLVVKLTSAIPSTTLSNTFIVENQTLKGNSSELPITKFNANVLNSYYKNGSKYLIASNSIPNYEDEVRCDDKVFTFTGKANNDTLTISSSVDHGLYSGDSVYYSANTIVTTTTSDGATFTDTTISKFTNVEEGVYFVLRVDAFSIKIAKSKADLANGKFVVPTGTVTDNKFTYFPFYEKPLAPQKIYREIDEPIQEAGVFTTKPGTTGVLVNGVEVENYKSSDVIFYGGIKSFEVTSTGKDYDVINPPTINVTDGSGTGATGSLTVSGSLSELRIINKGFDYLETPKVTIDGGSPTVAAEAQVNLIEIDHKISFQAGIVYNVLEGGVDLQDDIIGFTTFHNLRDIEQVVYDVAENPVIGLGTNQSYFAKVIDATRITLHSSFADANLGINTVALNGVGNGLQTFSTVERKKVASNIIISNPGSGYKNQERTINVAGISTALNKFTIENHGYNTDEIIRYTPRGTTEITGISSETDYFVGKIDDNNFYLYALGTGSLDRRYYIDNNIPANITGTGTGCFNYKPITVTVSGLTGVNTSFGQKIDCTVQPIFRGSITSANVSSEGVGYGSSEILNFDRKPNVLLESGKDAQLTPVVVDGSVREVIVNKGGSGYNSPPNITVTDGKYCKLTPVLENGAIKSVIVVSGGIEYRGDSQIIVLPAGNDGAVSANLNQWTVNKVEQKFNKLTDDDCIITEGHIDDTTQLVHLYAPRNIRSVVYGNKSNGERQYQHPDLTIKSGLESDSKYHSPIIGWAYDGSPIYGPFGYDKPEGGVVRRMVSGYEAKVGSSRPPLNKYPLGFFVEDYSFTGLGDLNESNGRFCVTPEYPNGTFCYFATFQETPESVGAFKNFRKPQFPYLIGNTFQHKQNEFNFKKTSNHVDYDLVANNWRRITTPYKINSKFGGYDFIFNSNNIKEQVIEITGVSKGSVDTVGILTGGTNYKVNDRVIFKGDTDGKTARGKVSKVGGKPVNNVDIETTTLTNIEFQNVGAPNKFIGFTTEPHNLINNTRMKISGLSDYFAGLDKYYNIGINTGSYILLDDVDTSANTGIVTYFSVGGAFQYPFMRPNDIINIESEKIKVLNVEPLNNRIRVLRAQNGTSGAAHTGNVKLFQDPRSFSINVGALKTTKILKTNTEFYFDPAEALGIGSETTVGAGKTIVFSNPGAGVTNVFVPEQQIYIPNHTFSVNDSVGYHTNGGDAIEVWNGQAGVAKTTLDKVSPLFVAPFDDKFIGLSTVRVGMGTTGYKGITDSTVGLLYFTNVGTSSYHSFKTNFDDVVTARAERTKVTVSTASTHGLIVNDQVSFKLNPKNERTIVVKYDNFNRRIVFDPQTFVAGNVNTASNTIGVSTSIFKTGDKVIHTSGAPAGGLVDEKMYYVYMDSPTSIKLVEEKFELNKISPNFVNITSASGGTLSKINPTVSADSNLKFDLSDASLSFISNAIKYPAFEMKLYTDSLFINQFLTSHSNDFEVKTSGVVGTDGELTLNIKHMPFALYYKFVNVNDNFIIDEKKIVIDEDVISNNTIFKSISVLDGNHTIIGIGSTTYNFDLDNTSLITSYDTTSANAQYDTSSLSAFGSIKNVDLVDNNYGYTEIPGISSIRSGVGTGAILFAESKSIGKIRNQKFQSNNIGWNYPTDQTLKPTANLPEIVEINPLASFERIGITTSGADYLVPPTLIVRDGVTNEIVDCVLTYELGDPEVTILTNSRGFYPTTPRIIATNNSNGFLFNGLTLTGDTVKLDLTATFDSDSDYPFFIGGKVYVENVSIGINTTGKGYNSEQYKHELFSVVGVKTNAGGAGAYVEFTLEDKLKSGEFAGNVISIDGARVIPEEHLPEFKPVLGKNKFSNDETVSWGLANKGVVDGYNQDTDILKIKTSSDLEIDDLVIGDSSRTRGIVVKKFDFDADIKTGAGTTVNYGWTRTTGFLNDSLQRMPNNDYYQRFSYSLKSEIPFEKWDNTVGSLNHTAGFKKFSDLQVISKTEDQNLIPYVNDTEMSFIVDCIGEGDLNCWNDFDLGRENLFDVNGQTVSDTVFFENVILTDYFESKGNRVLSVDDVSHTFNSNEREEAHTNISNFESTVKFAKSLFLVQDTRFTDERQFQITTAVVDDEFAYMTSYAKLYTFPDLGHFDVSSTAEEWNFQFHPIKFSLNDYFVSSFTFAFEPEAVGVAETSFGDVIHQINQEVAVPTNTVTNIVSVGTSFRSLKVMNLLVSGDEYHFAEFNIIHNNTDVSFVEYNNIDENNSVTYGGGIGTYSAEISGSDILLKFHPNTGIAATSYSQIVCTAAGQFPGITTMNTARIGSAYTSIPSDSSPTAHVLSSYDTVSTSEKYSASYQVVTVEDLANNEHEMFEIGVLNSLTIPTQGITAFGVVETDSSLGTIGVSTSGNNVQVTYTANPNTAVRVRSFFVDLRELSPTETFNKIEMNDGYLRAQVGNYFGTKSSVATEFELKHNGDDIFKRQFDGSSTVGVNTLTNQITLPNHFFQSGEAVKYTVTGVDERIQIVSTDFGGSVGSTTRLPEDLFVIKVNDASIGFATNATDAQAVNPVFVGLTTVGVGNSHFITATKQNTKALVSIDNIIQAPIAKTGIAATLSSDIIFDTTFATSGITSIASNDIIKIDDEFMRVTSVTGTGVTFFVQRPILGSTIQPHLTGATIEKFVGNYTITDNTLNFVSAPYGNIPLSTTSALPDERDYTGISTNSSFHARVFTKRGITGSTDETYSLNHVFDDVSEQFTGVSSNFTLKSDGADVTGITSNTIMLVNNIFQAPQGVQAEVGEYQNFESVGVTTVRFTAGFGTPRGYNQNIGGLPIGGMIVSVGSSEGFGYQPLVGAGGTAIVSNTGTISAISIGNTGSGYRSGVVTAYNVGVQTYFGVLPILEHIGTAIVTDGGVTSIDITNPGSGYTNTNAPVVVIEEPLSYDNIPLIYSSSSSGVGTEATANIKVGQGSSVIEFELNDFGFGFKKAETLTIPFGGATGIPTNPSLSFSEFQLTIQDVYSDNFNGYSPGEFQVLDRIDDQFDGIKKVFPLTLEGEPISIRASRESNIEVDQTLLVFINDILQVPRLSYTFEGGSQITFNEAPKGEGSGIPEGDTSRILFYKGAGESDVVFENILETVKIGDTVELNADIDNGQSIVFDQDKRVVTGITTIDAVQTNLYKGPGLANNRTVTRPLSWCKQTIDRKINGQFVGKDRQKYEPIISPTSYLITSVGSAATEAYVDSVRPLYDGANESSNRAFQNSVSLISQNTISDATATATVGTGGTISAITITDGGSGYDFTPTVTIAGIGTLGTQATATASVTGGVVTGVTITNAGTNYTTSPLVYIQPPKITKEVINVDSYSGDFGVIVGIGSTNFGAQKQLFFDVYIPTDSFMRDASLVGTAQTVSGISTGDFIVVRDTFLSIGSTFASAVGVADTFLDCVYQVGSASTEMVTVTNEESAGIVTAVRRIKCNVDTYGPGITHTKRPFMGNYSWGKIVFEERTDTKTFDAHNESGVIGISTSGLVQRTNALKFKNYI